MHTLNINYYRFMCMYVFTSVCTARPRQELGALR